MAMEDKEKVAYPGRDGQASDPVRHERCQRRLQRAVEASEYSYKASQLYLTHTYIQVPM